MKGALSRGWAAGSADGCWCRGVFVVLRINMYVGPLCCRSAEHTPGINRVAFSQPLPHRWPGRLGCSGCFFYWVVVFSCSYTGLRVKRNNCNGHKASLT